MKRTQIYLPTQQIAALKERAQKQKISISEVIRTLLAERLSPRPPRPPKHEMLMEAARRIAAKGFQGPRDLASRVDHYLYE